VNLFKRLRSIIKFKKRGTQIFKEKNEETEVVKIQEEVKPTEEVETSKETKLAETKDKEGMIIQDGLNFNPRRIGGGSKSHTQLNQDSFLLDTSTIVVADGAGESIGSEIASETAVRKFVEEVKKLQKIDFDSIREVWLKVGDSLKEIYEKTYVNSDKVDFRRVLTGFLATTLLVVIELKDSYIITYCGNGSIWLVRGDFWEFLESKRKWPWCVDDLVIPHSTYAGEEALYGFLDYRGLRGFPSIMQLQKGPDRGEIFIVTTDGISSKDKLSVSYSNGEKKDPQSLEIDSNIYSILLMIKDYLYNGNSFSSLSEEIRKFLESRKFFDDATVGILISDRAFQYFEEKISKMSNKIVMVKDAENNS